MNGYIETGYIAAVGTLGIYGITLMRREQLARRRLTRAGVVPRVGGTAAQPTTRAKPGETEDVNHATDKDTRP